MEDLAEIAFWVFLTTAFVLFGLAIFAGKTDDSQKDDKNEEE